MLNIFRRIPKWKLLLENSNHHSLDEKYFSKIFVKHKNFPDCVRKALNQLFYIRRSTFFIEAFSTPNKRHHWIDGTRQFPTIWQWNKGKLTNNINKNREFPYLHFMYWKTLPSFNNQTNSIPANHVSSFKITKECIQLN